MGVIFDIETHARDEFPRECVGYVSNGIYYRLENISNNPEQQYQLSPNDKMMLFKLGDKLTALVHSHPTLNNNPSGKDLGAQRSTKFPFWIIGTDGKNVTNIRKIDNENSN